MCSFHLLFRETTGERQTQCLTSPDRFDVRVSPHGALFTAMIRFAWLAFTTAVAPARCRGLSWTKATPCLTKPRRSAHRNPSARSPQCLIVVSMSYPASDIQLDRAPHQAPIRSFEPYQVDPKRPPWAVSGSTTGRASRNRADATGTNPSPSTSLSKLICR